MYTIKSKEELIKAFRLSVSAKEAFAQMARGEITKEEFAAKGYNLAKLV